MGHFGALSAIRHFGGQSELSDPEAKTPIQSVGAEKPHETVQPNQNSGGSWFKFALQYFAWSKYAPLNSAIAAVLIAYYMHLIGMDSLYTFMYFRTNILYYEAYNKKSMQEKLTDLLRVHKDLDEEDNDPRLPMNSVMEAVRLVDPERFIVVDGMKGVGKSTTMALLCLDHMERGHPAL